MGVWAKGQRSIWENVDFPSRNGVNGKPVSPWTRIRTIMISTGCSPATTYLRAQLDVVRIPKRKPSTGSKCARPVRPVVLFMHTQAGESDVSVVRVLLKASWLRPSNTTGALAISAAPNLPLQRLTETSAVNVAEEENGKPESLRCQDAVVS